MPSGASSAFDGLADDRFQRQPGLAAGGADGAGQHAGLRDGVGRHPALTAPHTITVLVRGSMRRDSTPGSPVINVPSP